MRNLTLVNTLLFILYLTSAAPACRAQSLSKNRIHLISYFQARHTSVFSENNSNYNISLRRFKLIAKGKINSRFNFYTGIIYKTGNSSSTDNNIYLLDAYLNYSFSKSLNLRMGQFKPPFGWERFVSDYKMPGTERSQVVDRLIPNGALGKSFVRDYGVQFFGKLSDHLKYEAALMAGSGANIKLTDTNFPMFTGRLSYTTKSSITNPFNVTIQLACSRRKNTNANFSKQLPGSDRNIFSKFEGTDLRWNSALYLTNGKTDIAFEYISSSFNPSAAGIDRLNARGWFLQLSQILLKNFQGLIKYEKFDPDISTINKYDATWITIGTNYLFNKKHGRLMLDFIHKMETKEPVSNDTVILQFQYFLFGS